ncbi:hypothetical protein P3T76_006813 [Phytophthora citrophthora]|uniref:Uncharacterized protein n=1 Tax=Phytophthora citrophthora TaxID=4793 RepID=A0AAD9GNN6_9STRA|nr:hypothetical protein P3T76_006813 [Phytophthora citrophthora]
MSTDVDTSQVKMGFAKADGSCSLKNKGCLLSALGFIFVLLNLAALWALHFADRPVTKGSLRSATRFTTTLLDAGDGDTPNEGDAVSFNSNSVLRKGAGTTAYLNQLNLGDELAGVGFINFAPMGTNNTMNAMSYVRTDADKSTKNILTTVSYTASTKTLTTGQAVEVDNAIRGLATLSNTRMILLTHYQAPDYSTKTSVVPVALDSAAGTATPNKAKTVLLTTTSPANFIAPLTSTSFVVAYYNTYSPSGFDQLVKVGTVATDGTITLTSSAQAFGAPNTQYLMTQFGKPLALKALANTAGAGFVIPYYNQVNKYATNNPKTNADVSGLCVTFAVFSASLGTISSFSDGVCDTKYRPNHYPEPIALSDNVLVIAFYDTANNNALTLVTVKYDATDNALSFKSSYVFPEVFGNFNYDQGYEFFTTPRLRLMSGNRLAVSFMNPALDGRLSVRIFEYSNVGLKEMTAVLPVALPGFNLSISDSKTNTAGAVTHDLIVVGPDTVVASYVGARNNFVHQRFIAVENLTPPVGVIQSYSSDKISIATQGRVDVDGLTTGEVHYATTMGVIVSKRDSYFSNSSEYVYAEGNALLVTADSRVGIAVDDDSLFVSTTF